MEGLGAIHSGGFDCRRRLRNRNTAKPTASTAKVAPSPIAPHGISGTATGHGRGEGSAIAAYERFRTPASSCVHTTSIVAAGPPTRVWFWRQRAGGDAVVA